MSGFDGQLAVHWSDLSDAGRLWVSGWARGDADREYIAREHVLLGRALRPVCEEREIPPQTGWRWARQFEEQFGRAIERFGPRPFMACQ